MNKLSIKKKFKNFLTDISDSIIINKILRKIFIFNKRISNHFLNDYEYNVKKIYLNSFPKTVYLSATNLCNYRCKFCEIHYFYAFAIKKVGKIFSNDISLDFIQKFKKLFTHAFYVELSSGTGEPLVNPFFLDIAKKLKEKKISLSVTTNASLLTPRISKELVDMKFNSILVSLHSGEAQNYHELQGGNFNDIIKNLEKLIKIKTIQNSTFPIIKINHLIFELNKHTTKKLISKMKEIGVDSVNINQYYANRNEIGRYNSFYFNEKLGNEFIKDIYQYAKSINFKLTPQNPNFISLVDDDTSFITSSNFCNAPWSSLKFIGCVEHENSLYISVCNRILLFRLNYQEFNGDFLKDIWNNKIIRYLRLNANNNPICRFCRNSDTPSLRCLNNEQYQIVRDENIRLFFEELYKKIKLKPRKGIYLLDKNPYEYE